MTKTQMTHTELSYWLRQVLKTQKLLEEGYEFSEIDEVFLQDFDAKIDSEKLWSDERTQKMLQVLAI